MKKKPYPKNPMAITMSYDNRLKRYNEDKDELLRVGAGLPAIEFQKMLNKLIAWWDV